MSLSLESDDFIKNNSNTSLADSYSMSKRILDNVKRYFEERIYVNSEDTLSNPGIIPCDNLGKVTIGTFSKPIDLYIKINAENNPQTSYFAAAAKCSTDPNGRPNTGVYYLNFHAMEYSDIKEYLYFSTFAHEFTHILGFSDRMWDKFIDAQGKPRNDVVGSNTYRLTTLAVKIDGVTFDAIVAPELIAYAKEYYNCNTIVGIPLENNGQTGTAGSHWEKTWFPDEYMNPTIENPGIISYFTFKVLEASGWYTFEAGSAQNYTWGRNEGCSYFKFCPANELEYCPAELLNKNTCYSNFKSKAYCSPMADFIGVCRLTRAIPATICYKSYADPTNSSRVEFETYGPHSRCIEWILEEEGKPTTRYPMCHKVKVRSNC